MRETGFLRTPIKASHESRLTQLAVSEQPLKANPDAFEVYPQTLNISFEPAAGTTEIEIAPLWEGQIYFLADDTTGYPTKPEQVTPGNFDTWNVVGDLVLHTSRNPIDDTSSIEAAFGAHVKMIRPAPSAVRYSKVRLTKEFVFDTLSQMPRVQFINSGTTVSKTDPLWHQKFVLGFLRAKTSCSCPVDPTDASQDFANRKMPSVNFAAPGTKTIFRVVIASRVPEAELVLTPSWFEQNHAYDDVSGELLVPPPLLDLNHQRFNPSHPGHCVISAFALYQSAENIAYAPGYDAAKPIRTALTAPRSDGAIYRRIDLIRPPAPGNAITTSHPQRPFPQYQLAFKPTAGGGATQALRIPMSGRLYLPLLEQEYRFWAVPRSVDPNAMTAGDQLMLSRQQPSFKYIDFPSDHISYTPDSGDDPEPLYAHLIDYDSRLIWTELFGLATAEFQSKAKMSWNVTVLNLWIFRIAAMIEYRRIYGYVRAAAGRHGFAPEFLHAVFFGEGSLAPDDPATPWDETGIIEKHRKDGAPYADVEAVCGFIDLGLDVIQDTAPNLVANNYLDPALLNRLENPHTHHNELGKLVNTSDVAGWEAATEMVAAELHSRLDEMLAYCAGKGISVSTEEQRRFLAYMRYNVSTPTAQGHADHLNERLRPWVGPEPTDQMDERFNTLQRLAVAEWYELAQVYR